MESDGVGKVKFKRRQDQKKPYDRRQSLLGRVGNTVKDMLKPSWLVDLVSSVKKKTPPHSPEPNTSVNTFQPDAFSNSFAPGQGMSNSRPEPRPPLSHHHQQSQQQHQVQMSAMSMPPPQVQFSVAATDMAASQSGNNTAPHAGSTKPSEQGTFTSDSLPFRQLYKPSSGNVVLNGEDDNSEMSEYSVSTSGCSSMIPRPDRRDYQREVLQLNESKIQQLRQDLGGSVTPSKELEARGAQSGAGRINNHQESTFVHVRGFSQQVTEQDIIEYFKPLVPQSVLFTASGGADVEFTSCDEAQKAVKRARPTLHHRPVEVTLKHSAQAARDASRAHQSGSEEMSFLWSNDTSLNNPQPAAKRSKPGFNISALAVASKSMDESTSGLNQSVNTSSYYPGKTTFGGAASHRRTRLKPGFVPQPPAGATRQQVRAKPLNDVSFGSGVTSSTAKKILDTLERMSTPLSDAKKIPNYKSSLADSPMSFTPASYRRRSLVGWPTSSGPPVHSTNTPCRARIAQNLYQPSSPALAKSTAPASTTDSTQNNTVRYPTEQQPAGGGGRTGKMKRERTATGHYSSKRGQEEEEEEVEVPNLPTAFTLPVANMPKINFNSSSVSIKSTPSSKTATAAFTSADKSSPDSPPVSFQFSSPLQTALGPANGTESPEKSASSGQFQFSSPISVDKKASKSENGTTAVDHSSKEPAAPASKGFTFGQSSKSNTSSPSVPPAGSLGGPSVATELKKGSVMDILTKNSTLSPALTNSTGGFSAASPALTSAKPAASSPAPAFSTGGMKAATELKKGSVMDILGKASSGSSPQSGGLKPAGELKTGSVMDILGKSSTNAAAKAGVSSAQSSTASAPKPLSAGTSSLASLFKKSEGSWECPMCMVQNKGEHTKCPACETPKPGGGPPQQPTVEPVSKPPPAYPTGGQSGLANLFKKAVGSWECPTCMVQNKGEDVKCPACETPNPSAAGGSSDTPQPATVAAAPVSSGPSLSQMFKKSADTWECDTCMVTNKASATKCVACEASKPGLKVASSFTSQGGFEFASTGGFQFGSKEASNKDKTTESSSAASGFKFGSTSSVDKKEAIGNDKPPASAGFKFAAKTQDSNAAAGGFKFGSDTTKVALSNSEDKAASSKLTTGGFAFGAAASSDSDKGDKAQTKEDSSAKQKAEASKENTSVGGFKFGQSSATATETSKADNKGSAGFGGFQMGQGKSLSTDKDAPSAGGFKFGAPAANKEAAAAAVDVSKATSGTDSVKFGAPPPPYPIQASTTEPAADSGQKQAAATPGAGLFQFSAPAKDKDTEPGKVDSGFSSLNSSPKNSGAASTSGNLIFGSQSQAGDVKPGITFGVPKPDGQKAEAGGSASASAATPGLFVFGQQPKMATTKDEAPKALGAGGSPKPTGIFQFGTSQNSSLSKPAAGGFAFNNPPAVGSGPALGAPKPASAAAPAAQANPGLFTFGAAAKDSKALGASSTSGLNRKRAEPSDDDGGSGAKKGKGAESSAPGGFGFGQQQTQTFGASNTNAGGFGAFGGSSLGAHQTPVFGSPATNTGPATSTPTPTFGAPTTTAAANPFGSSTSTAANPPAFGSTASFGSSSASTAGPGLGIFGSNTASKPDTAATTASKSGFNFGGAAAANTGNTNLFQFGAPGQSSGQPNSTGPSAAPPAPASSLFSFGQQQQQASSQQPAAPAAAPTAAHPAAANPGFNFSAATPNMNFTAAQTQAPAGPFQFGAGGGGATGGAPTEVGSNPFSMGPSAAQASTAGRRPIKRGVRKLKK